MLSALNHENSPFDETQLHQLKLSIGALSPTQSQWLSGYLAGRLNAETQTTVEEGLPSLTVLFGSETGNGEGIAQQLVGDLQQTGIDARAESLDRFRLAGLKKLRHAVFVISTHGEGDPPEEALDLFEFLASDRAPDLSGLDYRILALGDRSYEHFCLAGRQLDERLQALGASAFAPRVECDVDFTSAAGAWQEEIVSWAREQLPKSETTPVRLSLVPAIIKSTGDKWTREQPLSAETLKVQKITGRSSGKDVHHLELSLEGSGLPYQPGDALGVWAPNDPEQVDQLLAGLGLAPGATVEVQEGKLPLSTALAEQLEITRLSHETIQHYGSTEPSGALLNLYNSLDGAGRRNFMEQRQLADLVEVYPAKLKPQQLADLLRPLGPRSYSIASAQSLVEEEVHLTVATLESNAIGAARFGVASHFLNHRLGVGGNVRVFTEPNRRFRLPDDPGAPIIMVAAGTGIAPYRAFLQELEARGRNPDTWLIFGNPHQQSDFLYQRDFLNWRTTGLLNRIDPAWSRDQAEKRYVQHEVAEQAERLQDWLQRGAHIYLCGALAMGQAVQDVLSHVLQSQPGSGLETVNELRHSRRLHKDLY